MLKELAVLPLQWKEERLQKWYVLLAIIVCGLIWMPSFVVVMDVDNNTDNVIVNDIDDVIEIEEEPLNIGEKYGMPEPYYMDVEKGNKNINQLREALKGIEMPHSYEEGVWDCSESSAYVERILENRGFDTVICANRTQQHAWISVSLAATIVNCECIPPIYITDADSYSHREVVYADIYDALEGECPREWDWWLQA